MRTFNDRMVYCDTSEQTHCEKVPRHGFAKTVISKGTFGKNHLSSFTLPTYLPRRSSLNRPIPFNGLVFGSLSRFTMLAIKTIKATEQDQGALWQRKKRETNDETKLASASSKSAIQPKKKIEEKRSNVVYYYLLWNVSWTRLFCTFSVILTYYSAIRVKLLLAKCSVKCTNNPDVWWYICCSGCFENCQTI